MANAAQENRFAIEQNIRAARRNRAEADAVLQFVLAAWKFPRRSTPDVPATTVSKIGRIQFHVRAAVGVGALFRRQIFSDGKLILTVCSLSAPSNCTPASIGWSCRV